MKKLVAVLCFLFLLIPAFLSDGIVYAETEMQVKVITDCNLYQSPKLDYGEESGLVLDDEILKFGDILTVTGEMVVGEDCDFLFYPVSVTKNGVAFNGYVITNFVMNITNSALERNLDPNAKVIRKSKVYLTTDENNVLVINGEEVELSQYEEVKIIDGYDRSKTYHKVMFEKDGIIYTGYVKTSDLIVDGFNATAIYVVFIFILVGSIALSIFMTTRKKRKKLAKNK